MLAIPVKQTSVVTLLTNYHSYRTRLNIIQTKTTHFKSSFDSNDLYNDYDNDDDDDDDYDNDDRH